MYSSQQTSPDNTISDDKMEKIIDAVIDGKYSYACLIMLEEAGYDPTHYIPYRTYNRLQKQHQANYQSAQKSTTKVTALRPNVAAQKIANSSIADIDYVESVKGQEKGISGGYGAHRIKYRRGNNFLIWSA